MAGTLYVVATPIGNLGDITHRAVETLKTSDCIACEDTRHTQKLMRYLGLAKPLIRYDEHTHEVSSRKVLDVLRSGKSIALVTDAGTPSVSDPGGRLVKMVLEQGYIVIPIPGPSSPIAALSASGLVGEGFVFLGFLPRRQGRAKRSLQEAMGLGKTVIILESPFRTMDTVDMIATLAPESKVVIARELTKIHEEFIRGDANRVRDELKNRELKGEVIILVHPGSERDHQDV